MRTAAMVCLLVAAASAAGAQGLDYGVKAGVNLSTLTSDQEGASFDTRTGLVAGGFVTWQITGRLALQPEVLFSQKGASFDQSGGNGSLNFDYLEVPLLGSYRLFGGTERQLRILAGPSIALRLRARARASFGEETLESDVGDEVAPTDLAMVVGGAYHFGRLVIDARYSLGLSNIDDLESSDAKVKSRGIAVLAGWRF